MLKGKIKQVITFEDTANDIDGMEHMQHQKQAGYNVLRHKY